jgi:hypothetical protein
MGVDMNRSIAAALLLFFSTSTQAQTHAAAQTGNGFLQTCSRAADRSFQAGCITYFAGIADALTWAEFAKPQQRWEICMPSGVVYGQMMDITLDFLQKNPSIRHDVTPALVHRALKAAFPCRAQ